MVSAVAIVLITLPLYWIYSVYTSLQKNIKAAKLSGLPYVVIRAYSYTKLLPFSPTDYTINSNTYLQQDLAHYTSIILAIPVQASDDLDRRMDLVRHDCLTLSPRC